MTKLPEALTKMFPPEVIADAQREFDKFNALDAESKIDFLMERMRRLAIKAMELTNELESTTYSAMKLTMLLVAPTEEREAFIRDNLTLIAAARSALTPPEKAIH